MKSCKVLTPEIKELAKKIVKQLPSYNEKMAKNAIDTFISDSSNLNPRTKEPYDKNDLIIPSANEVVNYIKNNPDHEKLKNQAVANYVSLDQMTSINTVFSPKIRRDRIDLVAQRFKNAVEIALKERQQALRTQISLAETPTELAELTAQLNSLDKTAIVNLMGVEALFKQVQDSFSDYLKLPEEEQYQKRLSIYRRLNPTDTDEAKIDAYIKERVKHFQTEYTKINNYFPLLVMEAANYIKQNYGISYNVLINSARSTELSSDTIEEDNPLAIFQESAAKEESIRDGWMLKVREISMHDTLSSDMKEFLASIRKRNINNQMELTDLDTPKYLDGSYTFATLLDICKDITKASDIIPAIEKNINTKPWLRGVIVKLKKDPRLLTNFFKAFNSDPMYMWVQKTEKNSRTGVNIVKTIPVNQTLSNTFLMDLWRDNYLGGVVLSNNSIYNNNSDLLEEKAKENLQELYKIQSAINQINTNLVAKATFLSDNPQHLTTLIDMLKAVGISSSTDTLERLFLTNHKQGDFTEGIILNLTTILNGVAKGNVKARGELITEYKSAYLKLADKINKVSELQFEQNFTEAGKTYNAHSVPSYKGTLIKEIRGQSVSETEYQQFLQEEFGQYTFFKENGLWRSPWIRRLATDASSRSQFEHKILIHQDKVEYADWTPVQIANITLSEYWGVPDQRGDNQFAYYKIPIRSDNQSDEYIKFYKHTGKNYKNQVIDDLVNVVLQEFARINIVQARKIEASNNPNFKTIKSFDANGDKFNFIPELNDYISSNGKYLLQNLQELATSNINDANQFMFYINEALRNVMEAKVANQLSYFTKIGLFEREPLTKKQKLQAAKDQKTITNPFINIPFTDETVAKEAITEFIYNNTLAQTQIIQIFGGDLAFYKDITDFSKRYKQISSPATKLNTEAEYNGIKVGKEFERAIYIKDEEVVSEVLDYIASVVQNNPTLTNYEKADTLAKYGYSNHTLYEGDKKVKAVKIGDVIKTTKLINVTDGQSLRTLPSTREMAIMLEDWTDAKEQAFNNIQTGQWSLKDLNTVIQAVKPFYYGQTGIDTNQGRIKVPVQHKNSETTLFSIYSILGGETARSPKLRALNQFMIDNKIDVAHFNSVIKVGEQGAIKLSQENDEQIILDDLDKAIYGVNRPENNGLVGNKRHMIPNVVRNIPIKYYGKQQIIPEKDLDKGNIVGTQMKKIVTSDIFAHMSFEEELFILDNYGREGLISRGYFIEVNGEKYTRKELLDHYGDMFVENYLEAYFGVTDENEVVKKQGIQQVFEKLPEYLMESVIDNPRYGTEMMKALSTDEKGNPIIPYCEANISESIQMLATALIKNRVTKQKIKGGTLVQVSGWGMTDDLHITFKNSDGTILNKENIRNKFFEENGRFPTEQEYSKYLADAKNSGQLSVAYLEAYMPAYSKKMLLPFLKEGSQELDIEKMPDNLKKIIGYRIPTENKYSILPIYIKGFLPQTMGSAIMLPAEVTTIMGADFDIDKLNMIYPEFTTQEVLMKSKVVKELINADIISSEDSKKVFNILKKIEEEQDLTTQEELDIKQYVEDNKKDFYKVKFKKIKYNKNKTPEQNGLAARNNEILDIMWSVLTHQDTASKLLTPGGFDEVSKAAQIMTILRNITDNKYNELFSNQNVFETLNNYDLDELTTLAKQFRPQMDPLSLVTQIELHQRIMAGAKLIGISANHNSHHALVQQTNLGLSLTGSFRMFDELIIADNLHAMQNKSGRLISNYTSGYTAATVDNAKNPVLGDLNQNTFTAHASLLMLRTEFNFNDVGLLMNQPIVLEITEYYLKNAKNGMSKQKAIETFIKKYAEKLNLDSKKLPIYTLEMDFDQETMAQDLLSFTNKQNEDYLKRQLNVGLLFQRIIESSNALSKLVSIKPDTTDGGANGTIAKVQSNLIKIKEAFAEKEGSPISNADYLVSNIPITDKSNLREIFKKTAVPWYQAVYTLGLESSKELLNQYFPHFKASFEYVLEEITKLSPKNTLNEKTIKALYNQLFVYIMSDTEFFGNGPMKNKQGELQNYTISQKRLAFISKYPDIFLKTVKEKDFEGIDFLQRFTPITATDKNKYKAMKFKNAGKSNIIIKEGYILDWEGLSSMPNTKANEMAFDLIRYEYYRNGFGFGHSSSAHLVPTTLKLKIPEYIDKLREIQASSTFRRANSYKQEDDRYKTFIDQFILNNLKNPDLVIESEYPFAEIDGIVQDTLYFDNDNTYGIIKRHGNESFGIPTEFHSYIKVKTNEDFAYYKLKGLSFNEEKVEYVRITPLNMEYDKSQTADTMSSIYGDVVLEADNSDILEYAELDGSVSTMSKTSSNKINTKDIPSNSNALDAENNPICK